MYLVRPRFYHKNRSHESYTWHAVLVSSLQQHLSSTIIISCSLPACSSTQATRASVDRIAPVTAVAHFKELEESLKGWAACPKQIRRALLPEVAVDHSQKSLEADNRLRRWQADPQSEWGLLYDCSQAQMDFNNPAGTKCGCSLCFCLCLLRHTTQDLCRVFQHAVLL